MMLAPVLVFAAVTALMPVAIRLAAATGFLDRPGGRKQHEAPVPPVGGLVIFPVLIAAFAAFGLPPGGLWFVAALALLVVVGALDDRFHLAPRVKFTAQIVAAVLLAGPGGVAVHEMGNILGFGDLDFGVKGGFLFSAVAVVLLVNALNLMDGLDGLAGGIGFNALFWLALCAVASGNHGALGFLLLPLAAVGGFLVYNMRHPWRARASVFLGDSGSLALGLTLAWAAISFSQAQNAVIHAAPVAWLLALPIFDTCGQFARRVSQGRHPFDADSHHFHHHFLYAGLTPGQASAAILCIAFVMGAIGVGGSWLGVPDAVLAWLWTALLLAHIYMSMRPHRFRRVLNRLAGRRA